MDLAYFAADTLGVTLYQVKDTLTAHEVHQIRFGSWRLEMPITVTSDCIGATEAGFWVNLAKLRLYVVVKSKENWLFALDEAKLKECGTKTGFAGQTVKDRINEFKPAIRGVYHWRESGWTKVAGGINFGE